MKKIGSTDASVVTRASLLLLCRRAARAPVGSSAKAVLVQKREAVWVKVVPGMPKAKNW